ncbi:MAG: UDP-N-acetylmuramate dehydrogenase [Alphaproteobacteria bacterium]
MFLLKKNLPTICGRYCFDYPLAPLTRLRVGGTADVYFIPYNTEDLSYFLQNKPDSIPLYILGAASNVLIRDAGIRGCVIQLGSAFRDITIKDETVIAEASCLNSSVVMKASNKSLSNLEFLATIPGTIGGAVFMNAGSYGVEIKDILSWIEIMDRKGNTSRLSADELNMTYRCGNIPKESIVLRAAFKCIYKSPKDIQDKIRSLLSHKKETQPITDKTAGSTFKNPPSEHSAWKLIDSVGGRGARHGDAKFSEKHCNFMINCENATANDFEVLAKIIQHKVFDKTGILLEWEIKRLGVKNEQK